MKELQNSYIYNPIKSPQNFKLLRPLILIALFILVLLTYGLFLRKHYALDDYVYEVTMNQGDLYIQNGRFLAGIFLNMLTLFGINIVTHQIFFTFLSICWLTLSIYLLIKLFFELRETWGVFPFILLCLSCVISLCHEFMLGWFLFPETLFFMTSGLILSIMAIFTIKNNPGKNNWILCFILLLAAISFYQAAAAFFVAFAMLYVIIEKWREPVISVLKRIAALFLVYGFAGFTQIGAILLFNRYTDRTNFRHLNPLQNIHDIITSLQHKLQNTNLGAKPIFAFAVLMIFLVIGGIFLFRKNDKKTFMKISFLLGVLIIGTLIVTIAPHFLTSVVDVSPRSIIALLSLPGIICLFLLFYPNLFQKQIVPLLMLGFLVIFLLANTIITYSVATSRFTTNRLDRAITGKIYQEIKNYERKTGHTVTHISFRHDLQPVLSYPGLTTYGNFRALGRDWTVIPIMSLVSGRKFTEETMPDPIYNKYFQGRNWDSYNPGQLLFIENTLYLMLF